MRDVADSKEDDLVQTMNELSRVIRANNFDFVTIVADPGDRIFMGEQANFRGLILLHG